MSYKNLLLHKKIKNITSINFTNNIITDNVNININDKNYNNDDNLKKFIYVNTNKSGIGDRLLDIMLIYTYSKYLKCDKIYLCWHEDNKDMVFADNIYANMRKIKTPFREKDYLLKNLLNFITLPSDIIFVDSQKINNFSNDNNTILFTQYMGVSYSVYTFIDTFLPDISEIDKNEFIKNYFDNFNLIAFKNIPEYIVDKFNNNDIVTIHLRRGDKIIDDNGTSNNINIKYLDELNLLTENFINKCINLGYKNICIVSDEKKIRNDYCEKFKEVCNIIYFDGDDISQTYYDLYCIANSKKILLSQIFSTFSILGSLINCNNLYYLYNSGLFIAFNKYKNIIYHEELN